MSTSQPLLDLIGLGFGPANLSIAGAIIETRETCDCPLKDVLFLEKHPKFQWHPGMLLPDARMQISFMKDLATLRSPRSPITFLSYLHSQDRLINFINRGSTIPTRREYADYLSWAAQYVQDHGIPVLFGTEVVAIDTNPEGIVTVRSRSIATGEIESRCTRNLVISPGGTGRVPHPLSTAVGHPLMAHSSAYLTSIDAILSSIASKGKKNLRIAVVGAGQSAAEVALNLKDRLSNIPAFGTPHTVEMLIRKGALRPSDDSGFANEVFDPSATDDWYSLTSPNTRALRLKEYKSTNYSVVNPITLESLYEVAYVQKVESDIAKRTGIPAKPSTPLISIRPYSNILSIESPENLESDFNLTIQDVISRSIFEKKYDAIVCATGYQRTLWIDLLKDSAVGKVFGLSPSCHPETCRLSPDTDKTAPATFKKPSPTSSAGSSVISTPPTSPSLSATELDHPHKILITRGYRLLPSEGQTLKSRIYLQGVEEATHGLSDTLLSILGIRSGEVVADLCKED